MPIAEGPGCVALEGKNRKWPQQTLGPARPTSGVINFFRGHEGDLSAELGRVVKGAVSMLREFLESCTVLS